MKTVAEHKDLQGALSLLLEDIERGAPAPTLTARIAELERLCSDLDQGAPALLRHYLEKRSYQKALAFLEGRDETQASG